MLADLLAPLDYPRRSVYNLARAGGNVFTGDATWQDLLRALPGAAGLAATPFLGPLGGAGVAGGLQGLGGLVAPETFAAPTPEDLVEALGGDRDSLLQALAARFITDPMTIVGPLAAYKGARRLARLGAVSDPPPAPPNWRPPQELLDRLDDYRAEQTMQGLLGNTAARERMLRKWQPPPVPPPMPPDTPGFFPR